MEIRDFGQMRELAMQGGRRTLSVAAAHDEHSLMAVARAMSEGVIDCRLVGNRPEIEKILEEINLNINPAHIIHQPDEANAAAIAVDLVRQGEADFLMKGKLLTQTLMRAVLNKQSGLYIGRMMSHMAILDIPHYHKLLAATDGGIIPYPDLEAKKQIALNGIELYHRMGYERPKLAAVCAVEIMNPKLIENVEAAALKEMALCGEIPNCEIEGPISMDLATDMASVIAKDYESKMAGNADILLMHEMSTCNIMIKSIIYLGGGNMAGCMMGAKCPIVMPSRGSSYEDKYNSLMLSKLALNNAKQ